MRAHLLAILLAGASPTIACASTVITTGTAPAVNIVDQAGNQTGIQSNPLYVTGSGGGGGGAITAAAGSFATGYSSDFGTLVSPDANSLLGLTAANKALLTQIVTNTGSAGAVTVADGADVMLGAIADAAATAGGTGTVSAKLRETTSLLNSILTGVTGSIPSGSNPIGSVTVTGVSTAANQSSQIAAETQIVANTAASVPAGTNFAMLVGQAPTALTAAALSNSHCTAVCASTIVTGAHNLYGFSFNATAAGWLLFFDAASCPTGTVSPLLAYPYPTAGVPFTAFWPVPPTSFATGIAACVSSTGPYTMTAATTAFIRVDYK